MSVTHVAHPAKAAPPRDASRPDRTDIRRDLTIAAILFLAVLIAEAAFVFAAADYIPAASAIYATVP
jgi:hypothetical protein